MTKRSTEEMVANLAARAQRELGHRDSVEFIGHGPEHLMERASDAFVELADALKDLDGARTLAERVLYLERVRRRCGQTTGVLAVLMDSVDLGLPS